MFDYNALLDPGYSTPRCIFCSYVAVNGHSVLSDAGDSNRRKDDLLHVCLLNVDVLDACS